MDTATKKVQTSHIEPLAIDADRWLPEITRRIVEAAHPAAIWLFGSRARGTQRPDSDVDLLVVLPQLTATRRAHAIALRQVLADIPVPQDLLVASVEEFNAKRDVWAPFPSRPQGTGDSSMPPEVDPCQWLAKANDDICRGTC